MKESIPVLSVESSKHIHVVLMRHGNVGRSSHLINEVKSDFESIDQMGEMGCKNHGRTYGLDGVVRDGDFAPL